jgi:isoleucyl-tRNA synthetase
LDIEAGFGMVIAMDSKLTPELIAEWYARDLVRHIQESRKEADFQVDDRIQIQLIINNELVIKWVIDNFKKYIEQETLSTIVDIIENSSFEKEIELEEYKIKLALKKV